MLPTKLGRCFPERNPAPSVHRGLIVSGDQFVHDKDVRAGIRAAFPEALAVEMEGAAVAQVCHEMGVPFACIRLISDTAGDEAFDDFRAFLQETAGPYARAVLRASLRKLGHAI
jgi:adenosylhomocysteine nucleosidase